jgi:SAM-dependent methyltransferase
MPTQSHEAREVAEGFGADAARYQRTRPSYPSALVTAIVEASPGPDFLDAGIGTGLSARPFRDAGGHVLGVEPDPRMADAARTDGFEVEVSTFEAWEPGERRFDAVIAGQSWHWIDPVAGAVQAARVLRPGGRLAPFWNVFNPPPEIAAAFAGVYARVLPDAPIKFWAQPALEVYLAGFVKVEDAIRAAGAFTEPEQWRFDWERPYTRDEWLDQVPTQGGHQLLPPDTLAALLDGMGAVIGDGFVMGYAAITVTAALRDDAGRREPRGRAGANPDRHPGPGAGTSS